MPKALNKDVIWLCDDCQRVLGKLDTFEESCTFEDDLEIREDLKNNTVERLGKKERRKKNCKWMRATNRRKKKMR